MLDAARCPAAIASTIDVVPVTASPPAKTAGCGVCRVSRSTAISPRGVRRSSAFTAVRSGLWPMAKTITSAASTCSVSGIGSTLSPCGVKAKPEISWQRTPVMRWPSRSTARNVREGKTSIPSASVSSTSQAEAGIVSRLSTHDMPTQSAPRRRTVWAASTATFPPPSTSTRFPAKDVVRSRAVSRSSSVAMSTSGPSAPGSGRRMPRWAPTATNTASNPSASNASTSATGVLRRKLNALGEDGVDLALDDLRREAVSRHANSHHPAGDRERLEDRCGKTLADKVKRGRHASRPAADDGDALRFGRFDRRRFRDFVRVGEGPVGDETLEGGDRNRGIDIAAGAGRLALVVAHPAADRWERILQPDRAIGVGITAGMQERHVALGALPRRAGIAAGRRALFGDDVGRRDRLRERLVDRRAQCDALVRLARNPHRAHLGAFAASRALFVVDIARRSNDLRPERSGLAFDRLDRRAHQHADIRVCVDLGGARRHHALRAIERRKGVAELRHLAANVRQPVDEHHRITAVGDVERGGDAGDPRPDDERRGAVSVAHAASPCMANKPACSGGRRPPPSPA